MEGLPGSAQGPGDLILKDWLQVCRALRLQGTAIPRTYEADFQRALYTFRHQRVYDPSSQAMVHLRPLPPRGLDPAVLTGPADDAAGPGGGPWGRPGGVLGCPEGGSRGGALDFLGPLLPQQLCMQVATGESCRCAALWLARLRSATVLLSCPR